MEMTAPRARSSGRRRATVGIVAARGDGSGSVTVGALLAVVGLLCALVVQPHVDLCGSALGSLGQALTSQAAQTCAGSRVFYDVSWLVCAIGVIVFVLGLVQLSHNPRPPELPPGWYEWRPGRWRWWDGQRWHKPPRQ